MELCCCDTITKNDDLVQGFVTLCEVFGEHALDFTNGFFSWLLSSEGRIVFSCIVIQANILNEISFNQLPSRQRSF